MRVPRPPPRWTWSLPLAVGLSLVILADAVSAPLTRVAGEARVDALGTWWFHWFAAEALRGRTGLLHTDLQFFPWGKDILRDTGANLVDALLVAPVRLVAGGAAAWNTLYFGILVTNGAAAAWLTRRAGPVAFASATVFAVANPFVLHELECGRPTQAVLAPLLLALGLADPAEAPSTRRAVTAGALLALTGWTYWFAGLFGALALVVLGAGRRWRDMLVTLVVAAALTAPIVVPLFLQLRAGETPGLLRVGTWWSSHDLSLATGETMRLNVLGFDGVAGYVGDRWTAEGYTFGLAGLFAAVLAPGRWRLVAVLGLLLALGPWPGGVLNPVYVGLANVLPPFTRLYWPVRGLVLAVAAGVIGCRTRFAPLVAALVVAEAAARGTLFLSTWKAAVPAPIAALRGESGAVLSLPYATDQWALVHQTVHERPLFNGMQEPFRFMAPAQVVTVRTENTFLVALLDATRDPFDQSVPLEADIAAVRALGLRWVVLRKEPLVDPRAPSPLERARSATRRLVKLLGPTHAEDDAAAVWDLDALSAP